MQIPEYVTADSVFHVRYAIWSYRRFNWMKCRVSLSCKYWDCWFTTALLDQRFLKKFLEKFENSIDTVLYAKVYKISKINYLLKYLMVGVNLCWSLAFLNVLVEMWNCVKICSLHICLIFFNMHTYIYVPFKMTINTKLT